MGKGQVRDRTGQDGTGSSTIGKIQRDSVDLRENMNLMSSLLKIAYFVDFPPIFCLIADFLPEGGSKSL